MGQGTPNQTTLYQPNQRPQQPLSYDQFVSQQPRNPFPQSTPRYRQYPANAGNMMGGEGAMGAIGQSANRFNEPLTGDALMTAQQRRSASNLMGGGNALNMAGQRGDLIGRGKGGFGGGMDMPPPGASYPRPAPMLPPYSNSRDTAVRGMPRYPGVQPANMMGGLGALRGIGDSGARVGAGLLPGSVMNANQSYGRADDSLGIDIPGHRYGPPMQAPTRAGAMPPAMRGRMGV
jgi:hypothetical protein